VRVDTQPSRYVRMSHLPLQHREWRTSVCKFSREAVPEGVEPGMRCRNAELSQNWFEPVLHGIVA